MEVKAAAARANATADDAGQAIADAGIGARIESPSLSHHHFANDTGTRCDAQVRTCETLAIHEVLVLNLVNVRPSLLLINRSK